MSKYHNFIIKHRILFYFIADITFALFMSLFYFIVCSEESFWMFSHLKLTLIFMFLWMGFPFAIWIYERICKKHKQPSS